MFIQLGGYAELYEDEWDGEGEQPYVEDLKIIISCFLSLMAFHVSIAQQTNPVPGFYDELKKTNPDSAGKIRVASMNPFGAKKGSMRPAGVRPWRQPRAARMQPRSSPSMR